MTSPIILAERANTDQDRLLVGTIPLLEHTSVMLQQHMHSMFDNGHRFGIKGFLRSTLEGHLTNTMVSAHVAGIRRAMLMRKNHKPYKSRQPVALELSIFRNIIDYVRNRGKLDLKALQKKYNTLALKVLNSTSDDIHNDISKTVEGLIKEGAHVVEAKKVLATKFAEHGIRPTSKSQLETIFRTQTQIAFAAGKYKTERGDPDIDGILWGYRYVTTGDDRVRPTHAILDGTTLPKDDEFWQTFYPPNGWNCRCQAVPLFVPSHIVEPPTTYDGQPVKPDKGFAWNAGKVFNPLSA